MISKQCNATAGQGGWLPEEAEAFSKRKRIAVSEANNRPTEHEIMLFGDPLFTATENCHRAAHLLPE